MSVSAVAASTSPRFFKIALVLGLALGMTIVTPDGRRNVETAAR